MAYSLEEIIEQDGTTTPSWKAEECLRSIASLGTDDLAVPGLMVGAQVYSLLAVAEGLKTSGSAKTIADAVCDAAKIAR